MAKALAMKTGQVIYLMKGDPGDDGKPGSRGPSLRGPMDWKKVDIGFEFLSGKEGEQFVDYVVKDGVFYLCTTSHDKTEGNGPGSDYDYWQAASEFPFVATDLLMAAYAVIENLGVRFVELSEGGYIRMTDGSDNVLFEVKDGNVTCNTGKIGSFSIVDGSLFNTGVNGFVGIRNGGLSAYIGSGLPSVLGYDAAGVFHNDTVPEVMEGSINIAAYFRASGAKHNFAFKGTGNGILKGLMEGYALQYINSIKNQAKVLDIKDGKYFCIYANDDASLMLPRKSGIQDALNDTDKFAVLIHIFGKYNSPGTSTLYGRTTSVSGGDDDDFPYLYDHNGNNVSWSLSKGDSLQVLLCWDGYGYYAQIMNQQN